MVRYGWTFKSALLVLFSGAATALMVHLGLSSLTRVACAVFFGACAVVLCAVSFSRRTALRVDGEGVTLGGHALFRYGSTLLFVPWSDIEALVRWEQVIRPGGMKVPGDFMLRVKQPYLGIKRRPELPPMPSAATPMGFANSAAVMATARHVPGHYAHTSRAVSGWRLDADKLTAALARFAPGVELKDLRGGALSDW
ncbi:hypothetical protein GCM10010515_33560 [Streptomyces fructofermentans]|uniref:PH domain-containing protein n=1 Tax=Streptomyces fructofermentans TaxID=152141 RepID=A0A918KGZ6_9ACTN|nr:hypothetical protein GCM10010515_33560 [Streptomyces fructofermentans]